MGLCQAAVMEGKGGDRPPGKGLPWHEAWLERGESEQERRREKKEEPQVHRLKSREVQESRL